MSDALNIAVGAALQQSVDDQWHPIAYFSRKLIPHTTCYSTFNQELLAVYLSICQFRHMVEGREFSVFTDHKPLRPDLSSSGTQHSPWHVCQLEFISQFTSNIQHVKGVPNPVADALSRIEITHSISNKKLIFKEWWKHMKETKNSPNFHLPHPSSPVRFPLLLQQRHSFVIYRQGFHDRWPLHHSDVPMFDSLYTHSLSPRSTSNRTSHH